MLCDSSDLMSVECQTENIDFRDHILKKEQANNFFVTDWYKVFLAT